MNIVIGDRIGSGGNGVVYKGTDNDLDRPVAVKFFTNSFDSSKTQIEQHVAALKRITSPHVVAIFGTERLICPQHKSNEPEAALIMEFVDGERFVTWIARPDKTRVSALQVAKGLISGLAAFHERDMAHGDLHANNVMVTFSNVTKLVDPMEHDPLSARTTELNAMRQATDIRRARDLLLQILQIFPIDKEALFTFNQREPGTLPALLAAFEFAMGTLLSTHVILRSTSTTFYEKCREGYRIPSALLQQDTMKESIRELYSRLDLVQKKWATKSLQAEDLGVMGTDAVAASEHLWTWTTARAEVGEADLAITARHMRRLLRVPWPKDGATVFVQLPRLVLFFVTYVTGAAMAIGPRPDLISPYLNQPFHLNDRERGPLWSLSSITSWIQTFGRDATIAWTWLRNSYAKFPVLREIFPSADDFDIGLTTVSLNMHYKDFGSRTPQKVAAYLEHNSFEHLAVAPL